jgi:hypothetical protein
MTTAKDEQEQRERILKRNAGIWDAKAERQLRRQLGRMRKPRVLKAIRKRMRRAKQAVEPSGNRT